MEIERKNIVLDLYDGSRGKTLFIEVLNLDQINLFYNMFKVLSECENSQFHLYENDNLRFIGTTGLLLSANRQITHLKVLPEFSQMVVLSGLNLALSGSITLAYWRVYFIVQRSSISNA